MFFCLHWLWLLLFSQQSSNEMDLVWQVERRLLFSTPNNLAALYLTPTSVRWNQVRPPNFSLKPFATHKSLHHSFSGLSLSLSNSARHFNTHLQAEWGGLGSEDDDDDESLSLSCTFPIRYQVSFGSSFLRQPLTKTSNH